MHQRGDATLKLGCRGSHASEIAAHKSALKPAATLGLDYYGPQLHSSYHHCACVTCAHGCLRSNGVIVG